MIPIFIITCDRLEVLQESMESYHAYIDTPFEIVICDQGTTYPPTKEFLKKLEADGIKIYRWPEGLNDGKKMNLRRNDRKIEKDIQDYFEYHPKSNYVVTDPDIALDNVEHDILEVYAYFLEKMPQINTVGPMLRIDDIPDYYPAKNHLISSSLHVKFHSAKVNIIQYKDRNIKYVFAPIHTTFGMYRKETRWSGYSKSAIRVLAPYSAKHLDWYVDPESLSDDQKYYMEHGSTNAHWSKMELTWI